MENKTRQVSPTNENGILLASIVFITLIGFAIRLAAPLQASFPLNDGGLFYAMIVELQEAHYAIPLFVTYNAVDIPFAYPPLAFYLTGLLADLLHVSLLDLVRLLPAIVSGLTIPAFYSLSKEITSSKLQIGFAVFAFAVLPRDFAWLIMGGGITRSFGLLFAILTMTFAHRFYKTHSTRHLLTCILLGALTVAAHPEATVHTAITALVLYLWKDRSLKGLFLSLGIAVGILTLTAPWWGVVIARHGAGPFQAAMTASGQDSHHLLINLLIFFRFLFTNEPFLPILSILGLIGLFASLARKQTLLPAWFFILYLIEPRGGTLYMMLPLSLLIGYALESVILPSLHSRGEDEPPQAGQHSLSGVFQGKVLQIFILFLFSYGVISAYSTNLRTRNEFSLHPTDLEALNWVRENTPEDSEFLLVTGQLPLRDAWSEWFPVLTERHSQATVFGYEWINDGNFGVRVDAYKDLQACAYKDVTCLDNWSLASGGKFSYVYLWSLKGTSQYPLSVHLQAEPGYDLVYQNDQTMIFHRNE